MADKTLPIAVAKKHTCRECSKPYLQIIGASDDDMTVECTDCGTSYNVEIDAFDDGGIVYWPLARAATLEEG